MSELVEKLLTEFDDKDYAHAYIAEHGNMLIAAQIRILREQHGWTQSQLAEHSGMAQERISTLEDEEYEAWTLKTLRKLGSAFDVALQVSFVPFSTAIIDVVNLSRDKLKVTPRDLDIAAATRHKMVKAADEWKYVPQPHLTLVQTTRAPNPVGLQSARWCDVKDGVPVACEA